MWDWIIFSVIILIIIFVVFLIRRNKKKASEDPASTGRIFEYLLDNL